MASTTSLLKSAAATRKKIRAQEDALKAFIWESSAQTRADYEDYRAYLEERLEDTTDPADQLTYMSKQRTIRRSFVSNELQREQMRIMEGTGTTQTKMEAIQNLYEEAVANEDYNLAQNLVSQWQALSIQAQQETEANLKRYQAASSKEKTNFINSLTKGVDNVTLPTGDVVTPLSVIQDRFAETGDINAAARAANETLEAIAAAVIDQYNSATSQEEIDKLEQKYGAGLEKLSEELFIKIGGQTLNYQDIVNTIANDDFNNPLFGLQAEYNEATGQTEFKLKKNNVDNIDYVRRINENGDEEYMPMQIRTDQSNLYFGTSDIGRGLSAQITDDGSVISGSGDTGTGVINMGEGTAERSADQTIGNRLKALGIQAKQNGTTIVIKLPNENVERVATIQPDGSLRYFGDDGNIFEIGLNDRNIGTNDLPLLARAGEARIVSPEELSDFGTQSGFGGQLSAPSTQGQRYISDILGKTKAPATLNLNTPIRVGNDFTGGGTAVTSSLLQTAGQVQKQVKLQKQAAMQQQMLQQQQSLGSMLGFGATPNINQTPVQQLTSSGVLKRQLRVSLPQSMPRITVAAPTPQPKIQVSAPAPTPRIGISSAPSTPRLTVR